MRAAAGAMTGNDGRERINAASTFTVLSHVEVCLCNKPLE